MKRLPTNIQTLLDGLKETGQEGWISVSDTHRRQWEALARRGLIEYHPASRQHEARLVQGKKTGNAVPPSDLFRVPWRVVLNGDATTYRWHVMDADDVVVAKFDNDREANRVVSIMNAAMAASGTT